MRLSSALLAGGCGPAHLRPQREPRHPAPVRHIPRPAAMGPAPAMRPPPCSALARSSVPVQAKRGLWDCLALPGHPQRVETPGAHKLGSRGAALLTARPSPLRSRPPSPPASLTGSLSSRGAPLGPHTDSGSQQRRDAASRISGLSGPGLFGSTAAAAGPHGAGFGRHHRASRPPRALPRRPALQPQRMLGTALPPAPISASSSPSRGQRARRAPPLRGHTAAGDRHR